VIHKPGNWRDPSRRWRYSAFAGVQHSLLDSLDDPNAGAFAAGGIVNYLAHPRAIVGLSAQHLDGENAFAGSLDWQINDRANLYTNAYSGDHGSGVDLQGMWRYGKGTVIASHNRSWQERRRPGDEAYPPLPPGAELPQPYPRPSLRIEAQSREAALAKFGLALDRPVLALCPGAEFGEAKRWPSEHYAAVADAMTRQGWQVWLFGSKNDHPVGEQIRDRLIPGLREESYNLAGETSLAEAIDLMSCADAVVSNDSGLMHVAAALNRPLVAVYGSTSPGFTPPLAEQVEVVRTGIECSPCFDRTCRFGHYNCLRLLEPGRVIAALHSLGGPNLIDTVAEVD